MNSFGSNAANALVGPTQAILGVAAFLVVLLGAVLVLIVGLNPVVLLTRRHADHR